MWQFWEKEKEGKTHKIQIKDKNIFEFDLNEEWDITQMNFEYNSQGRVSQMIIYIENEGE